MALISAVGFSSRFTQLTVVAAFFVTVWWFLAPSLGPDQHFRGPNLPTTSAPELNAKADHPIDDLIRDADEQYSALLEKETTNIHDAAKVYRERRGRQPPPGFDVWFEFAKNSSAIIVEEFWDQIYHDLNPFWAVPAKQIRDQANNATFRLSIRNGKVTQRSDAERREWLFLWQNLTQTIGEYLPDVDMAINHMDESRMVVEWEEINQYVAKEKASRKIVPEDQLKDTFQSLSFMDKKLPPKFDPDYDTRSPYWSQAVVGCAPHSDARKAYIETDFTLPPPMLTSWPEGSYKGYVKNWTLARSPCDNAHLQGLHGTFIEPLSIATTKRFFPLFGGSKLPMNNEILLPAAMYWTDDPFYSGGDDHGEAWRKKKSKLVWRGAASGGRNRKENWTRFQRHRFVSMINATDVYTMETLSDTPPPTFLLPANNSYDLAAQADDAETGAMSRWIKTWSNAAVVHLLCFPATGNKWCPYTDQYYRPEKFMPMKEQYAYKYLPDIDGNSFSGRYRGFLASTSLPIKATIYQEWHDSRIVPWKHFVPMDNTFIDIYGIMQYFVGNRNAGVGGHDEVARQIAIGGKQWAEKVLRREDMQIYVLRLLLEYARICDDERERMGWKESRYKETGVT